MEYRRADELPAWRGTVTLNGQAPDLGDGDWTFSVRLRKGSATAIAPSCTVTGEDGGFLVEWAPGALDIAEGWWDVQLTARRTDGKEFTIADRIEIVPRLLEEA